MLVTDLPDVPAVRPRGRERPYRIALVIPLQGPAGLFGASCEAVAELAAAELNAGSGLLGRPVELVVVDGGARPATVAEQVGRLVDADLVDAVTGWHISAVREAVVPAIAGRVPYVYTSLYEGGEHRPGVFCSGETPVDQLAPALRWLRDELGLRTWAIVGNDYVWPLRSSVAVRAYAAALELSLLDEQYLPLGSSDFGAAAERVGRTGAQAVLMLLVGQDAVAFNRSFAALGLQDRIVRFSPLMEENMLLASGPDATQGLYVAAAYFRSLTTAGALDLVGRYVERFGPHAPPLNNAAESCYEGIRTLFELARRAGSTQVERMLAVADSVGYDGPRGVMRLRDGHLRQRVHLAVADDVDFSVLTSI
ncbi:MAG TPA: substrate-binding domain-containing protein [Pseudonocardia sp.]|jgi:ABC-type branched-subunit amino acid transport system substrate-binding protein|uniref:substrate-binding domain-containing protein n=1 Tax=Pseudonocardia sp. TaxID=60912 RepID=UPI002B4AC0A8|nr:substrate-binding domain-containing protein [Pseudonocardia sp.]HLU60338.1 substrate-binding domain-containing protein [Pseudonocardia sp.]